MIHLRPYQDNSIARGQIFTGWPAHEADAARHVIAALPLTFRHASSIYPARLLQRLLDEWYIWHRGDMLEPTRGAVRQCYDAWQAGHQRVLLAAVTGDGKTEIAVKIAYDCARRGWRCIFVCDQQNLVTQSAARFARYGLRVGVIWAEAKKHGLIVDPTAPIQVASLQTLQASERAAAKAETVPFWHAWRGAAKTLWILDEAHDQTAWSVLGQSLLRNPGSSWYLGLTGSPFRLSAQEGMGDLFDALAWTRCYRDAVRISIPELVAKYREHGHMIDHCGSILPVVYKCAQIAKARISTAGVSRGVDGDFSASQLTALGCDPTLLEAQLQEWSRHQFQRTLAFCATVEHAQACGAFWSSRGIIAGIVTGEDKTTGVYDHTRPVDDRFVRMSRGDIQKRIVAGSLRITFSIGAMIKGVDIAELDSMTCIRPTESFALFAQMVGRGRRPCPHLGLLSVTMLDLTDNSIRFALRLESMTEFVLEKGKPKGTPKDASTNTGKACPQCQAVIALASTTCPYCLFEFALPPKKLEAVELKTITLDTSSPDQTDEYNAKKDRKILRSLILKNHKLDYAPGAAYHAFSNMEATAKRKPKDEYAIHTIYPNPTPYHAEQYMYFLKRHALKRDAKKRKAQPDAEFVRHWFRLEFGQTPAIHPDFFTEAYPAPQNNSPV